MGAIINRQPVKINIKQKIYYQSSVVNRHRGFYQIVWLYANVVFMLEKTEQVRFLHWFHFKNLPGWKLLYHLQIRCNILII